MRTLAETQAGGGQPGAQVARATGRRYWGLATASGRRRPRTVKCLLGSRLWVAELTNEIQLVYIHVQAMCIFNVGAACLLSFTVWFVKFVCYMAYLLNMIKFCKLRNILF
jgi:hypothetical protein